MTLLEYIELKDEEEKLSVEIEQENEAETRRQEICRSEKLIGAVETFCPELHGRTIKILTEFLRQQIGLSTGYEVT